jgi:hypothetical protein
MPNVVSNKIYAMITALILDTNRKNKFGPILKKRELKNIDKGKNNNDKGMSKIIKFAIVSIKTSRNVNGLASIIVFTLIACLCIICTYTFIVAAHETYY